MNMRTLGTGLGFVAVILLILWYFSSSNPLPDVGILTSGEATTSASASEPTKATKPTVPKAPATSVTSSIQFCPRFSTGHKIGDSDSGQTLEPTRGGVGTLQIFLARKYKLNEATFVDGIFDADTESYLKRYQKEEGLAQTGVLDYATQQRMLSYCLKGMIANGTEYPIKNFTFSVGGVTESLSVHEALQETRGTLLNGAFRIELISAGTSAKLRITGQVMGGLQSQTVTLSKGGKVLTDNWPVALTIELKSVSSSGATLAVSK